MAVTNLKDLKITKVDFVDQGANQDAYITLYKRKDNPDQQSVNVPDKEQPWLLKRLTNLFKSIGETLELGQEEIDSITKIETSVTPDDINRLPDDPTPPNEQQPDEGDIAPDEGVNKSKEGGHTMFDKSQMTPEDVKMLEELEKRYPVQKSTDDTEDNDQGDNAGVEATEAVDTPDAAPEATPDSAEGEDVAKSANADDIYKGLHPAVAKELESLKKFKEDAETKELTEVAKKYEIIGKKADELVPTLKSLKAAGGTAYNDMIAVLDSAVNTVEQSGAFSEVGKSGHFGTTTSAEGKINSIAKSYMEKDPKMSHVDALSKAWMDHPELVAEYDEQAGF